MSKPMLLYFRGSPTPLVCGFTSWARTCSRLGDPLSLAQKAVKAYAIEEQKGQIALKALILDADKLQEVPEGFGVHKLSSRVRVLRRSGKGRTTRHCYSGILPGRSKLIRPAMSLWPP